jgi:uncharacterized repeat protein (TIGR01451 family)
LKFWENAMLAPGAPNTVGPDLRFVVPINQVTVHSRGDGYLPEAHEAMDWPVHSGTDYARLGNWNQWLGFFARPLAAQDWAGIYDEAALRGVARIFPHQVAVGVKGFGFGWTQPIDASNWTDDGSMYIELHGGPSPTFWDEVSLDPGGTLEWTETWLPLRDIPALSLATDDLALGLKGVGPDLYLGLVVAGQHSNLSLGLWRRSDCAPLWREDGLGLEPGEAVARNLPGLGLDEDDVLLAAFEADELLGTTGDFACLPPTSQVDEMSTVQLVPSFMVSWRGNDPGGILAGYDIQVRDGDADAIWTDWLTGTMLTTALFNGQVGHTYAFRSRARDFFGNSEDWPAGEWQDAFTTVLLLPSPVLVTSSKLARPPDVSVGDIIGFEIQLENTGNLVASVQITDPLPLHLSLATTPHSSEPPAPTFVSDTNTILWSGSLAAGQNDVTISFDARVLAVPPGGVISNAVWIDGGLHGQLRRQAVVNGWQRCYLPLVLKR